MFEIFETATRDHAPQCRRGEGFADKLETKGGRIEGRAVPYGHTIELMPGVREVFDRGTFSRMVRDPARVKICLEHGQVVGRASELEERDDGLYFVGGISESADIPEARKARAMLADDLADELSIGFTTVAGGTTIERDADSDVVTFHHKRARLLEISIVPWGAYGREATLSRAAMVDTEAVARMARIAAEREWVDSFRNRE